jgi:hypothetical protein
MSVCVRFHSLLAIALLSIILEGCGGMGGSGSAQQVRLQVNRSGEGTVVSSPTGISCGSSCVASFAAGSTVTLSATASNGSVFSGWAGACSGQSSCTVTISRDTSVAAAFAASALSVTVFPATASLQSGESQSFAATVRGSSNTKVTWSVDGIRGGDASRGIIDANGLYTAPAQTGGHTIVATSLASSSKSGSAAVDVSAPAVLTHKYDAKRAGLNSHETTLTPAAVSSHFGKLFADAVDGLVFAQPLYMSNLNIPGKGAHNVLFVATEHDSVYALDADAGQAPLWHVSFIAPPGITTVPTSVANDPGGRTGLGPEVGVTGTPVIDATTSTLYVSAMTYESGQAVHRLHALDIFTGAEKFGGPIVITATVAGSGIGNDGAGHITFHSLTQNQRAGLLLLNGVVYIPFASFSDVQPYHGWLFAFDAQTLQQQGVFIASPDGEGAGIWQGGSAPAADDDGNIYFATADGTFDADSGGKNYGDTLMKVKLVNNSFTVLDSFTPFNQGCLNTDDLDLGSGGPALLPESFSPQQPVIVPSKEGRFYVVDRNDMGHYRTDNDSQILDWKLINPIACDTLGDLFADGPVTDRIYGGVSYFNGSVYVGPANTTMQRYTIAADGQLTLASHTINSFQTRGSTSVVSSAGTSNAILWVAEFAKDTHTTILRAYDAMDLSHQYFASTSAGDSIGRGVVFTVPVVIKGKVYVAGEGTVAAFGLK